MKYFLLLLIFPIMISCENKKAQEEKDLKELQAMALEMKKNEIDFSLNAVPKYFSAKTIKGSSFNSEDYKGKNLVVFVYDKSYLKKSDSYDMAEELNEIYDLYKDKVQFIGIVEGFVDNDAELQDYLKSSKIAFDQIDNTISTDKEEKLHHNLVCSPAKILIDEKGKVTAASCGGGSSFHLVEKLKDIK
ncbi:peroxiredoxin family protein [Flavobacterium reichenbachii]|uniref:AhpC/TSA family protein n=1 Tax=Flavobacterium reichenbachii TaxID=362418 RepID=A0A085ZJL2_9FLAO|nr:redoxin domain-containing protein [Flavobacterium reichenbachii]KFF04626.1 AhpC/TSA family protein [Flavobacterium reichenbachii]OXB09821.1 AhpC/TSA family protein [Flavobacterium reichenbachii]